MTVHVALQVSKTEGPSAVNASVTTIRGVVTSSWVRHTTATVGGSSGAIFELQVTVPVGCHAVIQVPLLGARPSAVRLVEVEDGVEVFGPSAVGDGSMPAWLLSGARLMAAASGGAVVELETVAGQFHFQLVS